MSGPAVHAQPGASMRRMMLEAPGRATMQRLPVPQPGRHEILLRIDVALTCGTDVKTFRRGHPRIPLPAPFGHEFAGTVVATGGGVSGFSEGDEIACVPSAPCLDCTLCRRGSANLCPTAIERMVFGAFGEYVLLPEHLVRTNVFRRPSTLSAEHAALLEPLACVIHGAGRTHLGSGSNVLIIGDGPIGLLFARIATMRGAGRVLVAGHHAQRLSAAASAGAETTAETIDQLLSRFENAEDAPDILIECTGHAATWEAAPSMVATGGLVLLYGGCPAGTRVTFDAYRIHYDEVDVRGAFHYTPDDVRSALALLVDRTLDCDGLITHRRSLDDFDEAFSLALDRVAIKVAIFPGGVPPETGASLIANG